MFARFCSIYVYKRPGKRPKVPSIASTMPKHGLCPLSNRRRSFSAPAIMTRNCSANVNLLTAAFGRRKACEEKRSWVSTGQPSQADIDRCWHQVRLRRISNAEVEKKVLMQIPQHQGGDSEWMVGLAIDFDVSIYLVGESETAARTL